MNPLSNTNLNVILLSRILVSKKEMTKTELIKEIAPLVDYRWVGESWVQQFEIEWQRLLSEGLLKVDPQIRLTESGRQFIFLYFGFTQLPPKTTWGTMKQKYLPARFLGLLPGSDEFKKRYKGISTLRAECLRQAYDLKIRSMPTITQAVHALLWKTLGIETSETFSVKSATKYLLAQPNGIVNIEKIPEMLCASAAGMRNQKRGELERTLIHCLVNGTSLPGHKLKTIPLNVTSLSAPTTLPEQSPKEFDLDTFARDVQACALSCPTGHWGENKVFISHVWRFFQNNHPEWKLDKAEFKNKLIEANCRHILTLSHADLVGVMNPVDVQESATPYLNDCFHFIRIGRQ